MNNYTITEYSALTGIEKKRDMTPEEIAALPEANDEAPTADA
jgi:hypothetical protein